MRKKVRQEEGGGELNIVPYLDIVTNLLMFMLLSTVGVLSLGVLDVGSPKLGDPNQVAAPANPNEPPKKELNLTVAISGRGFFVAGSGGVLGDPASDPAAGMDTAARAPTVPMKNGEYDYKALGDKMAEIKKGFPEEKRVILVADMNIPYEVIVHTMDATREHVTPKPGESVPEVTELFPQVWLSKMQ